MTPGRDTGRFVFQATPIAGLLTVQRKLNEDARGFLSRFYCRDEFAQAGMPLPLAQINHTLTRRRGAVRGMHFQRAPHAEIKLVSCLAGEVFDVAVDLRAGSPTFLQWHAEILSAANRKSFLIPEGFAHGFQTLSEDCELVYLHTATYAQGAEGGVRCDDSALAIAWPEPVADLSDRDRAHPLIDARFTGLAR